MCVDLITMETMFSGFNLLVEHSFHGSGIKVEYTFRDKGSD